MKYYVCSDKVAEIETVKALSQWIVTTGREMLTHEWAVPALTNQQWTDTGATEEQKEAFLKEYGYDIRDLIHDDFINPPKYYVQPTKAKANQCMAAINGSRWFPLTGKRKGKPAPSRPKTKKWDSKPRKMISGEWAIPCIPKSRLDAIGVPQSERDEFLAEWGQDIRELSNDEFKQPKQI